MGWVQLTKFILRSICFIQLNNVICILLLYTHVHAIDIYLLFVVRLLFVAAVEASATVVLQLRSELAAAAERVFEAGGELADIFFVHLYLADMSLFGCVNAEYSKWFGKNPPSRSCISVLMFDGDVRNTIWEMYVVICSICNYNIGGTFPWDSSFLRCTVFSWISCSYWFGPIDAERGKLP